MAKRKGLNDRQETEVVERKHLIDELISDKDEKSKQVNKQTSKQTNKSEFVRKTYHIEPDEDKAIGFKALFEGLDKSEIVRLAIKAYVEDKYREMVGKVKE